MQIRHAITFKSATGIAIAMLAFCAPGQKSPPPPAAGFTEDFSHGLERWWAEGGERVWIEDGRLHVNADNPAVRGGTVATVWWQQPLPADFEWELNAHVVSSSNEVNNINLFFCYSDPSGVPLYETRTNRSRAEYPLYQKLNGYIITFLNDTEPAADDKADAINSDGTRKARVRLRRNPGFKLLSETYAYHCRIGNTYRLKVVKRGGEIVFSVDGQELLRANDPLPWSGGRAGLRTYRTCLWWDDVRLQSLPPSSAVGTAPSVSASDGASPSNPER